jgi:hypothetical protein
MLMQGYNVQTVVGDGQVILAATPVSASPDHGQLAPILNTARANLDRIGVSEPIREVLADSGYWNTSQVRALTTDGLQVLIPPRRLGSKNGRYAQPETLQMLERLGHPDGQNRYRRRQQIVEPVFAHIKHIRGITRVLRRGKQAVQAEIDLIATTHNLLKLHRHVLQTA